MKARSFDVLELTAGVSATAESDDQTTADMPRMSQGFFKDFAMPVLLSMQSNTLQSG